MLPTIDRNAEILSGGFNYRFSCCWMYWLFVNFGLLGKFLSNRARESRFFKHNTPKLREFVLGKRTTYVRIASHFLTNIEYWNRVPTSVFVEIYLRELTTESEYDFFKVSKHRDFLVCPGSKISSTTKPKLWLKLLDHVDIFLDKYLQF